jgi:hypothetical protein
VSIQEEGAKVATSAIDGLKGNPLCLAVVALVIILQIIAYLRDTAAQEGREQIVMSLIEKCQLPNPRTP